MDPAFGKMQTYTFEEFQKIWTGVLILFAPNDGFKQYNEKVSPSKRFWHLVLVESVTHIRTVKEFGVEEFSNLKTENKFVKLLFTSYKSGLNSIFVGTSTQFLASIFTVILMWIGSGYVIDRAITPGELFSFYALIGYFTSPVASLIGMNKTAQNALIAADRLFEIMDLEREETENKVELLRENNGRSHLIFRY